MITLDPVFFVFESPIRPRAHVYPQPRRWSRLDWQAVPVGVLLVACLAVGESVAVGQEIPADQPAIRSVTVGLGGWIKVGKWAPVRVAVSGGKAGKSVRLVLSTADPAERTAAFVAPAVDVPAGEHRQLFGWFQPGRLGGDLGVAIHVKGVQVDRRTVPIHTLPERPFSWRMRIGGTEVSRGVDRIDIPVRPGQKIVFVNSDPQDAHGLVISGELPAEAMRASAGESGRLVDPCRPTDTGGTLPVVVEYEVTERLKQPVAFHGLATGWALSGRFVPADSKSVAAKAAEERVEIAFEGRPVVLSQSESLWLAWGGAAGMDITGRERNADQPVQGVRRAVPLTGTEQRLHRIHDLDAVDAIVIAAGDRYEITEADSRVMSDWVASGGHLVISVGAQRASWLKSPMAEWVPVRAAADRQMSDSDLRGLEALAVGSQRIPFQGRVRGTELELSDGRTSVPSLTGPLVGVSAYGFGRVTMLSVDIDRDPLVRWAALPRLVERLVEGAEPVEAVIGGDGASSTRTRGGGALSHSGISDLKTQLHGVQDEFEQVSRLEIWQVLVLVIAVLLLVGPVDFLFVRHVLKRPRATWVTLPLMILAMTLVAAWVGVSANGRDVLVNQLDIVDVDTVTGRIGGRTWATIYSADSQRFRIEARSAGWTDGSAPAGPGGEDREVVWSGVPEESFGGMHRGGRRTLGEPDYRVATGVSESMIDDLPVAVWSTRTMSASWRTRIASPVTGSLESTGVGQLSGELRHELPGILDDWLIAHGNRVFLARSSGGKRRSWETGTSMKLGTSDIRIESLKGYLNRTTTRKVVRKHGFGSDVLSVPGRYDPRSRNPADWIEILTFHQAAGGIGYTGLENRDLAELDLSNLLTLNRAVLLGRLVAASTDGTVAGTELVVNGEPVSATGIRRVTYVRVVLKVNSRQLRPRQMFLDLDQEASQ